MGLNGSGSPTRRTFFRVRRREVASRSRSPEIASLVRDFFANAPTKKQWAQWSQESRDNFWGRHVDGWDKYRNIDVLDYLTPKETERWDRDYPDKQPKPSQKASDRKRRRKPPRIPWDWGPTPRRILRDPALSANAKLVAAIIADSINLGKWNKDLVLRMSYADLGKRASLSRRGAFNAVAELAIADTGRGIGANGYLTVKSLGRGGCEFRFTTWLNRVEEGDIAI